jgi:putative ABC transport system ATP-binding protein
VDGDTVSGGTARDPLVVESVVKRFRSGRNLVTALDGANLTVRGGQFVAIMGASGSGKSTLLHAMAGLTDLDGGRVLVDGQDLGALADAALTRFRRRRIGLVFQAFNLIPTLTALDNVTLPCEDGGAPARAAALLDQLGLAARRHHKPDALSGGEQQRVAIARALATDPAIVLADEPTGSLDSVSGQQICSLLRALCRDHGRTIVIVTHEPHVAMWADRVVVLKDGRNLAEFATDGGHDPQAVARRYQQVLGGEAVGA